ncbi:hypothetical protein [Pseudomonas oryzihabitans]|uniref:hypothetical protein n=1 Tax=Pseudomonas oryzihabitans TaxID=47885 RepID=UPI0005A8D265|nr:hypothetical protein [Pseudomonas oryzihabitans]NMZ44242.1 hypothetical protein [Pseudomonas oryzihabitans]
MDDDDVLYHGKLAEARRFVQVHFELLVESGQAHWQVNKDGQTELRLITGETYIIGDIGITRTH